MKWYQNDYVKLATIIVGSIVLFTVLSKYNIMSNEGYDANPLLAGVPLVSQQGVGRIPAGTTAPYFAPQAVAAPLVAAAAPVASAETLGSVAGAYADRPKDCFPKDQLNAEELLPKDPYNQWAAVNPDGQGDLQNRNFLSAGYHVGIDTQGSSLRNPSYDLRPAPSNPLTVVSPWGQSTITPQNNTKTMDIL